ncbi:MAG TPA: hypothetical protein VG944_12030, partial [Fimbriimonas sp.]|nr:hypothetical protein [Fimbriimonas sp.]
DEDPQTIDFLLKGRAAKQLGVVRHGDLDRYFVLSYGTKITVDVDPKTRHIESILTPGGDRIQYDYPERIDPAIFVPRPQLVPGVKVFDFELDRARQAALVKRGIARKGDTVLRSVILDRYGCLWVFWTGYVPDGRLTKGYSVPGMPLGPASEPGYFTTSWNKHWPNRRYMVDGRQLVGMNRAPKQKIGTRITVKVPTKGGYVTFQNVPVQRILEYTEVLPAYEKVPRPGRM